MTIYLTFDFMVEIQFLWGDRFPLSLYEEIGRQKLEVYKSLKPDRDHPDLLTGSGDFHVAGRRFDVLFASDPQQVDHTSDIRPLRVINIEERT